MPMKLENSGWLEMQNEVKRLQETVRTDATKSAVRAAGRVIGNAMYERAPVLDATTAQSTALAPGALKDDIGSRLRTDKLGYVFAVIGPGRLTRHVARFVEYGHRLVKRAAGAEGVKLHTKGGGMGRVVGEVQQHPFLRPGYEASWQASLSAFAQEMKKQLGKWVN